MTSSIEDLLPDGRFIVLCGRADDARAWTNLLGPDRCLALALDDAPLEARQPIHRGASDHLAWQHQSIAGLDRDGWLGTEADAFDPGRNAALILPDPLDPAHAGTRRRLGRRPPAWKLLEDKTFVDNLWDTVDIPRAASVVADMPADLARLGALVDRGDGVVCCAHSTGAAPSAGGDRIWWWRHGSPPAGVLMIEHKRCRVRLMPLLPGTPIRLHGFALAETTVPFPPMELVVLPRVTTGTFLCAGAVTILGHDADLIAQTRRLGTALGHHLGYRGGFSVDGILTTFGFLPTDFNARLTSAMDAAPAELRVRLHLANLLTRHGMEPEPDRVEEIAVDVFAARDVHTVYGAATRVKDDTPRRAGGRWDGLGLVAAGAEPADVDLVVSPSPRGWLLTATVDAARLPAPGRLGSQAPAIFRLSDDLLGTDFGDLAPPFGAPGSGQAVDGSL